MPNRVELLTQTAYFLESERLAFRELNASDANERYYSWLNDPEINQFLENRFFPSSIESIREYILSMNASKANLFCAILLKDGNRHIGNIKLGPINWIHRYAEIGLLLGEKDCWGKGYATEAIKSIVDFGFAQLNLHKITAGCYETNIGSSKAFQKAGFMIEGMQKSQFFSKGKYIDGIRMGIINEGQ
jgi:RimJ/RimL family protein N-acetyltransferase